MGITRARNVKRIRLLLWIVGLLLTSGCISMHIVKEKAQVHREYRPDTDNFEEVDGKPVYYLLLPITIAGDVATSPFQLGYLLFSQDSHWGSATIHGIPVPLP
jgi:hypothetical protein